MTIIDSIVTLVLPACGPIIGARDSISQSATAEPFVTPMLSPPLEVRCKG